MEVILTQDIKGLGYLNDVITVKPGYGRNFLIPSGYAIIANESNKKRIAENVRQAAHKLAVIKQEAEAIANKVEGTIVQITTRTGEQGRIFGSITPVQIAAQLKEKGVDIDRKKITMTDNPKKTGTYDAVIDLHKEVKAQIKVEVVAE